MPDSAGQLFVRALGRAPGQMVASAERLLEYCLALDRQVPAGSKPGGNGTGGSRVEEHLMIALAYLGEAEVSRNKNMLPVAATDARAHEAAKEPIDPPGEEATPIGRRLVLSEA